MITLPPLPFKKHDLEPYITSATIDLHYGKHHKSYVDRVNEIISANDIDDSTLTSLTSSNIPELRFAASQALNHAALWSVLTSPNKTGSVSQPLMTAIVNQYKSWTNFKDQVIATGVGIEGSGWVWVCLDPDGNVAIVPTKDGGTLPTNHVELFVIDVWEHAYYVDYPADRKQYLSKIWNILNWNVINDRYHRSIY